MTMKNEQVLKQLESLAQLDIDATRAYTSAIQRIGIPQVKQRLILFRADHERHVQDLTPLIQQLGGRVPENSADFKGILIQGMTVVRSMMGNESAIKVMRSNEELTNKNYSEALELNLPLNVRSVVQRNREDERRHLDYINGCIREKIWDRSEKTAA
jgi:uncharacterized protein (TIGR02284 family)